MSTRIQSLEETSREKIIDYILKKDDANIYHHPFYYESYSDNDSIHSYGLVSVNQKGNVSGLLQWNLISEYKGISKVFTSRNISHGGVLYDSKEDLNGLIRQFNVLNSKMAIYTKIKGLTIDLTELEEFNSHGFAWKPSFNFIINLEQGINEVFSNFNKTKRKNIRKLEKSKPDIQIFDKNTIREEVISDCYVQLKETYRASGLPLIKKKVFLNIIKNARINSGLVFICVYLDQILIAHRILLPFKGNLFDWYAGSNKKYNKLNANDTAVYHSLKYGCENKFNYFDFGGAGQPNIPYGVRDFKKQFGGTLINLGFYCKTESHFRLTLLNWVKQLKN